MTSYIYTFIGLHHIEGKAGTSKMDFSYEFMVEFNEPGYDLEKFHQSSLRDIILVQGSFPWNSYYAKLFYFLRKNCNHEP